MKLLKRMRQWLFILIWKDIQDVLRRENKFNTVCVAKKKNERKEMPAYVCYLYACILEGYLRN